MIKSLSKAFFRFLNPLEAKIEDLHQRENAYWEGCLPLSVYRFYFLMDKTLGGNGNPFRVWQIQPHDLKAKPHNHISSTMHIWLKTPEEALEFLQLMKDKTSLNSSVSCLVNGHIMVFLADASGFKILHSNRVNTQSFVIRDDFFLARCLKENHVS